MQEKLFMTKGKIIIKWERGQGIAGLGIGTKRPLKR